MNRLQRNILLAYVPLTIIILVLDRLYPGASMVNYVKYATMLSLFLLATVLRKQYPEQRYLNLALAFVVLADFFFVYCDTLPEWKSQVLPLGVTSFTWAYLILILVWQRNFRLGWLEIGVAGIILAVFLPYYLYLWPYVQGIKFYSLSLFGVVLIYMSWTGICSLFRGYFSFKVSLLYALAGFFILISDMGVGLAISHPHYIGVFDPWLVNIIWVFYIPAWTLIVLSLAEPKFYRSK